MTPFDDDYAFRRKFTPKQRAQFFAKAGGRCQKCTRKLGPGDKWHLEHVQALRNGGTNDDDNVEVWCAWCKPAKDKLDATTAAKNRRVHIKHHLPTAERKKQGRAMPGTRRSGLRKRMNGKVEKWD